MRQDYPSRRYSLVALPVIAITMLFVMMALGPMMTNGNEIGQSNALRQVIYAGIFLTAIAGARIAGARFNVMVMPASVFLLLVYCAISAAWAVDPGSTVRRVILTAMLFYTICLIANQLQFERLTDSVRIVVTVILLANLLTVLIAPGVGIHLVGEIDDPGLVGDWKGFMMQKNYLGALAACGFIFCILGKSRLPTWFRLAGSALALFLLLKSGSKTSGGFIILSVVFAFVSYTYSTRVKGVTVALFIGFIIAAFLVVTSNWDAISAPFDSEDALTGRVQIWPVLVEYWRDHWLLGAGYGSFWNVGPKSPVFSYTKHDSFVNEISSGHNGYLDLLVQIGLPGLLLAIAVMILIPIVKLLVIEGVSKDRRALLLACILFCSCHNMLESDLMDRDQVVNVFWMLTIALVSRIASPAGKSGVELAAWPGVRYALKAKHFS